MLLKVCEAPSLSYAVKVGQHPTFSPSPSRRLHHLAIGSRDVVRLASFYREVLGLPEVARQHHEDGTVRSIWLSAEASVLMFESSSEPERHVIGVGSGLFLVAFSVSADERRSVEQRIEASGHRIEERTEYSSYTRDPDGNRVAISHYPLPDPVVSAP